ncbi:hypothetical protein [Pseudomonas sp. S2_E02]
MKSVSSMLDFRGEVYVSMFRRWLIVDQLGRNRNGDFVLDIQKAALFDFLLKNPKDMHAFLVSFKRLNENSPYADILYDNDAEYGAFSDVKEFLESMLTLEVEGYVELNILGSECYVASGDKKFFFESNLIESWKFNLSLLKPLVGKSLNILQKNSLR